MFQFTPDLFEASALANLGLGLHFGILGLLVEDVGFIIQVEGGGRAKLEVQGLRAWERVEISLANWGMGLMH